MQQGEVGFSVKRNRRCVWGTGSRGMAIPGPAILVPSWTPPC